MHVDYIPWQDLEPTEKQVSFIRGMQNRLGMDNDVPRTRKACSDLIGKLQPMIRALPKNKLNKGRAGRPYKGSIFSGWHVSEDKDEWDPDQNDDPFEGLECF